MKKRILVIEDELQIQKPLVYMLRAKGWDAAGAGTVQEALRLLHGHDWIILDLMLPDGNGGEILQHIRDSKLDIKVAVCSGCGDNRVLDYVRSLTPELFLTKPIDFDKLHGAIQSFQRN